ncbi:hypothetical protein QBC40DRAFT_268756 [Triangularia verruculosa]|uniref:Fungal STAND N-terminal Goodbye domain-containing protein n=1 Tax=Triangularia verruculosa TaxID=2587418 RepID=A0AAN7AR47_9PEZI|nr:hypothetical protein QBC40DRAFT_268756 [Triangularia verruculosa]
MIFPSAMEKFRLGCTTPSCEQPVRDIAGLRTWTEVYDKLRLARDTYTELTGTTGRLRRVWRWTADNIVEPARLATKVVPQMDIVTPVLGAVLIILEAIKKGAEVRKETLRAFDDLEDVFADVEVFLETFQNERSVIDHAIALVVAVLEAVVRAVRFFTRPGLIRGLKSIVKGKDYEAPLLESLTAITTRSKSLMAWAVKTHIRDFAQYSNATRRIHQLILNNQEHIAIRVDLVHAGVDEVSSQNRFIISQNERSKNVQDGMNATLALLMDKHEETKRELHFLRSQNREQQKILAAGQREISRLGDIIVRSVSPLPGSAKSSGLHPPPPLQHSAQSYFQEHDGFCQGDLWALLRVPYDIEIADADDIEEKREHLAAVDRARMEQIVHTQKFQQWIISPDSTKLLIHGNLSPVRSMETSSLSLFCATLAKAFRSRPRYLCLVWFCGRHIGNTGDSDDESDVESRFDGLDYDDSSSDEYHHHCSSFHRNEVHQDARTKKGTIRRMVQSLIGQLLSDHDFGLSYSLVPSADVALIEDGDLEELALLLRWLVQQLPEEVTLVFLIDGIIFYEREEFEGPMLDILGDILGFTATNDISATVKVLVTSPWPTTTVRTAFQEGHPGDDTGWPSGGRDSILSTEMIQLSQVDTSMDRLNRELQELGAEDI